MAINIIKNKSETLHSNCEYWSLKFMGDPLVLQCKVILSSVNKFFLDKKYFIISDISEFELSNLK